ACIVEVALADNVVAIEHTSSPVASKGHGYLVRNVRPYEVPHRGPAAVVEPKGGHAPTLPCPYATAAIRNASRGRSLSPRPRLRQRVAAQEIHALAAPGRRGRYVRTDRE